MLAAVARRTGVLTLPRQRPAPAAASLPVPSIRGFKGLESPVVILCALEDLDDAREQQLYVGVSRARSHCVIVGAPPAS